MESERDDQPALSDLDDIRARASVMPRGHAVLQLAFTLLMAAYMGVFVLTGSLEGGASAFGGSTMALLVPPMIVASGLLGGANERFQARRRTTIRNWIATGVFLALLVVLLIWGIAGDGYPWWVALVAAAVTLVIFGARPLALVLRTPAAPHEKQPLSALSVPVRVTTAFLGLFLGATTGFVGDSVVWFVMMIGLFGVIIVMAAQTSSWGLLRTGYEWRWPQWTGFGLAATLMFLLAVIIVTTGAATAWLAGWTGAVVAAAIIVPVFVPGGGHGASEA